MSGYDEQYEVEENLFGKPYPEFASFVKAMGVRGNALDLGCGQGRDVLMLAAEGFRVTGVDESRVGVAQLIERARARDLNVTGMVGDYYQLEFPEDYDVIVLDSILHFGKDCDKELGLLDRVFTHTKEGGYVFIFIHKSRTKEKRLEEYVNALADDWGVVEDHYIDYAYEETQTGFRSEFQFNMVVMRKRKSGSEDTQRQKRPTHGLHPKPPLLHQIAVRFSFAPCLELVGAILTSLKTGKKSNPWVIQRFDFSRCEAAGPARSVFSCRSLGHLP